MSSHIVIINVTGSKLHWMPVYRMLNELFIKVHVYMYSHRVPIMTYMLYSSYPCGWQTTQPDHIVITDSFISASHPLVVGLATSSCLLTGLVSVMDWTFSWYSTGTLSAVLRLVAISSHPLAWSISALNATIGSVWFVQ